MSSFNNSNFAGMNFGYHLDEEEFLNPETPCYPFHDPDAPIAGPSRSQDWYLNPSSEGYTDQSRYQESTLLGASGNHFVDPYALDAENVYGGFNASESHCC